MANYSRSEVVLVRYPFTDFSASKVRPAVVVSAPHNSLDLFIVPLTSKTDALLAGEFTMVHWQQAGLNVPSAIKRGIYTVHDDLVAKSVGRMHDEDIATLDRSLRDWIGLC